MSHFAYSFCLSLFHSIWQGGLLLLLYVFISKSILKNSHAAPKRNFLFTLILSQLALTLVTLLFYLIKPEQAVANTINEVFNRYVPATEFQVATPFIFSGYLLILVYKLSKTIAGWHHFNKLYKRGLQKAPLDLRLFTMLQAEQFSIKRSVKLLVSSSIQTPLTFGFFKPVILLPVALINQLSLKQAETLIIHELTHIRANDYLQNWIVVFAENIFFFNPFIKNICKKIKLEREQHCDETVIHFQYSPALYAQTLLQAEKIRQSAFAMQLAAVSSKHQLLRRIHFFADTEKSNRNNKNLFAPILLLFGLIFFTGYTVLNLAAKQKAIIIASNTNNTVNPITETPKTFVNNNVVPETAAKLEPNIPAQIVAPKKAAKQLVEEDEDINEALKEGFALAGFNKPILTKQVVVREQVSGTDASTLKVYNLVFENGEWVLVPGWMATSQIIPDSLLVIADSIAAKQLLQQ